jgi:hypothetical protein
MKLGLTDMGMNLFFLEDTKDGLCMFYMLYYQVGKRETNKYMTTGQVF